jgi:heat shock protein HtpX
MTTLYTQQDSNTRRTWFLMIIFLVVVMAFGWAVSVVYNQPNFLYLALVISLLMNVVSYWYSDKIVLGLYHARPAGTEQDRELINIVENLSITAGLPLPKIYVIDDLAPNAFATGRDKDHATVAVTSGLLKILDRSELEGVIAHELSHIGNRDILLSTVVVVLVGSLSILSDMFLRGSLGRRNSDSNNNAGGILAIIGIVLIVLSPLIAKLIQLAISRRREFLADASGALLTRYPEGLANALHKISTSSRPMQNATSATAHLFIANPLAGTGNKVANLFSTHPPVEERIKALLGEGK